MVTVQSELGEAKTMERLPFPAPAGMTKEQIEAMTVLEGEWRRSDEFVCACGLPAYYHPYTNEIWGCKGCGFTTYSVAVCFKPKSAGFRQKYSPGALHTDEEFGQIKIS